MASDALRAELMSVPGVAAAEVDVGESDSPTGVRVRLTADADARWVGAEVQRVLAAHGMRSRFPEPEAGASLPVEEDPDAAAVPPPPASTPPAPETTALSYPLPSADGPPAPKEHPSADLPDSVPMSTAAGRSEPVAPVRVIPGGLESVAVEERADGLAVRVTLDDGRTGSHDLTTDDGDVLDAAVIASVAAAVDLEAERVATEWMEVDGVGIVTVVLRLTDGALVAGAGVVRVGRAYAVGMATRAALDI